MRVSISELEPSAIDAERKSGPGRPRGSRNRHQATITADDDIKRRAMTVIQRGMDDQHASDEKMRAHFLRAKIAQMALDIVTVEWMTDAQLRAHSANVLSELDKRAEAKASK